MENPLRNLPSVGQLLEHPCLKRLSQSLNQQVVVDGVRNFLGQLRNRVSSSMDQMEIPAPAELADRIAEWLSGQRENRLRRVINATGILLHTGLGRAPLAPEAVEAIRQVAAHACSVEIDLATGQRGQRAGLVRQQLADLTGAESAAIANNNAAATMLALSSLARGREVIVSRGELVEIGGSYRLPEVMSCSGCTLREVGTTNKTRVEDYEQAINDRTGAILRVHTSNFRVIGFTETPRLRELAQLAHRHGLPLVDDIGSGALHDLGRYGLTGEPVARNSISDGADLVLFSGDKLVGGPQCGIIVGRQKLIQQILDNPLMRAMRVGKLTLAALSATLALHGSLDQAETSLPLYTMLAQPLAGLELRAKRIAGQLPGRPHVAAAEALTGQSMLGGGSVPGQEIPTWCVAVTPEGWSEDRLATRLRELDPAVMGRIQDDRLWLDMRTVRPAEDVLLVDAFEALS